MSVRCCGSTGTGAIVHSVNRSKTATESTVEVSFLLADSMVEAFAPSVLQSHHLW